MNVSSTYLSHIDGFSDVDPNAISSKYSMYMLVNADDNGEPICSCGKIYKGETGHPPKVRLEEDWKAVVRGEIEKSRMAGHIRKEKGNHLPLWEEVEIINRA